MIFDPAIDGVEHYIRIFALLIDFLAIPSTLLNNLPHHLYSHNCLRSTKSFVVAMAALKLSGFPSSVQAYQTFVRNTSPGPLPPAKLVISGSRWDSEIFIALYALADEERPGYIHPTIRKFFHAASESIQRDDVLWKASGAFSAGRSLLIPGHMLASDPDAGPLFAYYKILALCLEPARVPHSATTVVRSRPPPRTATLSSRVVAPSFDVYDDGLDTEMGEDEDNDPAFDPVQSTSTPGVATKKTETVPHTMGYVFAATTHAYHEMFRNNKGEIDPDDDRYEFSPERNAHTFTLLTPPMKSTIEDDGGPEVYEIDGQGNFVKNPLRPRPWAFEFKSSVRPAEPQHLAECLKLFQQRTIDYGVTTASDLDAFPPSFFQILHISGQGKYIGLVVAVVTKLWYHRRNFNSPAPTFNPRAKAEYVTVHYDYPFDNSLVDGRRDIMALEKAALDWSTHHGKQWDAVRSRVSSF